MLSLLLRRPVFILWLLYMGMAAAYLLMNARLVTDMSQFLPQGKSALHEVFLEQIRQGVASRLLLAGIEGADSVELARASAFLQSALEDSGEFVSVRNGNQGLSQADRDLLFRYRYLLLDESVEEYFSVQNIRSALQRQLRLLTSSFLVPSQLAPGQDPTMAALQVMQSLEPAQKPRQSHGVWFSADGRQALLVLQTRVSAFDLDPQQRIMDLVNQSFAGEPEFAGLQIRLSGPAVFALQAREIISSEAVRISVLTTVLVFAFLTLLFRNLSLVLFAAVPLVTGIVTAVLVLQLLFGSVHGITLAFGITLIGVAIDYPIHLFVHKQQSEPSMQALLRIWPTLRLGLITTVMGYVAMLFSGFTGLVQLGLFAVCGLAAAVAVTRWLLPRVIPDQWHLSSALVTPGLTLSGHKAVRWLFIMLAAASVVFVLSRGQVWEEDIAALNPVQQEQRQLDAYLRQQLGAPDTRHFLLVQADQLEQLLKKNESLKPFLDQQVAGKMISGYSIASQTLPSAATQRARQQALPDSNLLRERFRQAMQGLPFSLQAFEGFFKDVEASRTLPVLQLSMYGQSDLRSRVESLLFKSQDRWFSLVPLTGIQDYRQLQRNLTESGHDDAVQLLDLKGESSALMADYRDRALALFALGSLGILLVLCAGLRSIAEGIRVFVPVVGALAVTCMLLLLVGEKFTLFHLASMLLVIGIGLDFSLFFQRYGGVPEQREKTYRSLLVCSVTTIMVFGMLALATTPVLHAIGLTVATGTIFSLLYAVFTSGNSNLSKNVV